MNATRVSNATLRACYVRGFLMRMTNPKTALTWIAIISLGLSVNTPPRVAVQIVLGGFFSFAGIKLLTGRL